MAVSKQEALTVRDFHFTGNYQCHIIEGSRGGKTWKIQRVRASGICKTWKRDPERFHLPVKYGLRDSYWINNSNAHEFHVASKCPLLNADKVEVLILV